MQDKNIFGMRVAHCIGGWGFDGCVQVGVCKWVCACWCVHVNHDCVSMVAPTQLFSFLSPVPNVSVAPLPNDFLEWHGNIRAPQDTLYNGAIFHFAIRFSECHPM